MRPITKTCTLSLMLLITPLSSAFAQDLARQAQPFRDAMDAAWDVFIRKSEETCGTESKDSCLSRKVGKVLGVTAGKSIEFHADQPQVRRDSMMVKLYTSANPSAPSVFCCDTTGFAAACHPAFPPTDEAQKARDRGESVCAQSSR